MKQNQKSAAIGFIFITLLIDITGWGIIIPVVPRLIEELIQADVSEAAKMVAGSVLPMLSSNLFFHRLWAILVISMAGDPLFCCPFSDFQLTIFFLHCHQPSGGCLSAELLPE